MASGEILCESEGLGRAWVATVEIDVGLVAIEKVVECKILLYHAIIINLFLPNKRPQT